MNDANIANPAVKMKWEAPVLQELDMGLESIETLFAAGTDASLGGFSTSAPS